MSKSDIKIWLVDDDESILEVFNIILVEEGYNVKALTCGKEVLHELDKDMPDLILLDILMSEMDGRDIAKYLKSKNNTKDIPIIIMSADIDVQSKAAEAGADDFLRKPFNISAFSELVESTLKRNNKL